jgi:hypothetical protein
VKDLVGTYKILLAFGMVLVFTAWVLKNFPALATTPFWFFPVFCIGFIFILGID